MNCSSCGAAMRMVDGRNYFVCDYCSSFHFLESPSELTVLDDARGPDCPICRQPLAGGALLGQRVQTCRKCRGVLIPNAVFGGVIKTLRAKYAGERETPRPIAPSEFERRIDCPRCARTMETHPYYGPGGVVIDTCASCGLIWLDTGEIGAIERAEGAVWR
ncbi:MAG: zf-TFIIB domain-containing protein [Phycisphaerae bacterium]